MAQGRWPLSGVNEMTGSAPLGEDWIEEIGEVELIGGWAEVPLPGDFARLIDAGRYQVFITSYGPAVLFVQNRTARGFEIHTLTAKTTKRTFSTCCCYRIIAQRKSG